MTTFEKLTELALRPADPEGQGSLMPPEEPRYYATARWHANDVLDIANDEEGLNLDWTEEQAEEWLKANGKYIVDAMVQTGWEAIETLLS